MLNQRFAFTVALSFAEVFVICVAGFVVAVSIEILVAYLRLALVKLL